MKKIRRWFKRWWWTIVLVAVIVLGFAIWLLLPKPKNDVTPPPLKDFQDRAREEIERVRLEGEVEKARVTATADAQNQQLDEIEELGKDDPAEARRRLAAWAATNL